MSDIAVKVEGLGKCYRIPRKQSSQKPTVLGKSKRVAKKLTAFIQGRYSEAFSNNTDFWALRNISFEVKKGEAIGIIGKNGSGKSTLLRILSRITEPSEGQAVIHGRIGSLLQVGAGFHNELTGRENIYLNGSILGMRSNEIQQRFDDIVDFSEIGRFLDTPIKHYSSGMRVRLGFSIAINLDPEILLLDEVFAVGDIAFRTKCIDRLSNEVLKGRTVLFVSHNMEQIKQLVNRCIMLENGEISFIGDPEKGIEKYINMASLTRKVLDFPFRPDTIAQIDQCYMMDDDDRPIEQLQHRRAIRIRVEFSVHKPDTSSRLGVIVSFCSKAGEYIAIVSSDDMPGIPDFSRSGRYYFDATMPAATFNPNTLIIRPALSLNGKAIDNHPRFGQGLTINLIDPENEIFERSVSGRGSALLAMKPLCECGYLGNDARLPGAVRDPQFKLVE